MLLLYLLRLELYTVGLPLVLFRSLQHGHRDQVPLFLILLVLLLLLF